MKDLETIILPVLEMSCAVCANNVENTVKGLPGVEEASVNFSANTLSVKYHPSLITPQKMREAVHHRRQGGDRGGGRAGGRIRFGRGGRGPDGGTGGDGTGALPEATPEYDRGVGLFHSAGLAGNGVYAYARR